MGENHIEVLTGVTGTKLRVALVSAEDKRRYPLHSTQSFDIAFSTAPHVMTGFVNVFEPHLFEETTSLQSLAGSGMFEAAKDVFVQLQEMSQGDYKLRSCNASLLKTEFVGIVSSLGLGVFGQANIISALGIARSNPCVEVTCFTCNGIYVATYTDWRTENLDFISF